MKYRFLLFWLFFWIILFIFLQYNSEYHFYYIEQNQLFLFSSDYIAGKLTYPGGFALLTGEFLTQFFLIPYAGALITATLISVICFLTTISIRKIAPANDLYILYVLPALTLLLIHFDFNYLLQGTIAYILLLIGLYIYISIQKLNNRLILAAFTVPLLFWLGGSVYILFTFCILLWELLNKTPRGYWIGLILIEAFAIGLWSNEAAIIEEYRFVFLPDMYYYHKLEPKNVIYFSWISLPVVQIIAFLLRNRKKVSRRFQIIGGITQFIVIGIACWLAVPSYMDTKSYKMKKLDYFTRMQQWDKIIDDCKGQLTNYLYLYHLNTALFETDQFADQMFSFDQRGSDGLMPKWNRTTVVSTLLSDINFTLGNIAVAQEMAFESFVSSSGGGNPRMLKRLVQTNLIYGYYPVAEKYLDILEKTYSYKDWAKEHRRFLYNDPEVENDLLLSSKRKGLLKNNYLSDPGRDYEEMVNHYPGNRRPLEFLIGFMLLSKELGHFKNLVEKYYGTEILPTLPKPYQEAIITLSENDPDYWKQFEIPESTRQRFTEYKKQVLANKNKGDISSLLKRSFGDTYWFYYMFK